MIVGRMPERAPIPAAPGGFGPVSAERTVLGSVLNLGLAHGRAAAVGPDQVRRLLDRPGGGATVGAGDAAVRSVLHQALHLAFWAVLLLAASTLHLATLVPPVAAGCGPRKVAAADRAGRGTDSDATGPGREIDGRAGVAREIGRRPGSHERVVLARVLAQGDVQDWRSHGPARDR